MIAPSGACASVPMKTHPASAFSHGRTPGAKFAVVHAASVVRIVKNATTRFENSTYEW